MKRLFTLTLLLPIFTFSQKLLKNVDKLNGNTTYLTSIEKLYSKSSWAGTAGDQLSFSTSKTNTTSLITFFALSGKINLTSIDSNSNTYIKLKDAKIDTLPLVNFKVLEYQSGYAYKVMLTYLLTDSCMSDLKNNAVVFIRIETNDKNADFDIPEKNGELIKKALELF